MRHATTLKIIEKMAWAPFNKIQPCLLIYQARRLTNKTCCKGHGVAAVQFPNFMTEIFHKHANWLRVIEVKLIGFAVITSVFDPNFY